MGAACRGADGLAAAVDPPGGVVAERQPVALGAGDPDRLGREPALGVVRVGQRERAGGRRRGVADAADGAFGPAALERERPGALEEVVAVVAHRRVDDVAAARDALAHRPEIVVIRVRQLAGGQAGGARQRYQRPVERQREPLRLGRRAAGDRSRERGRPVTIARGRIRERVGDVRCRLGTQPAGGVVGRRDGGAARQLEAALGAVGVVVRVVDPARARRAVRVLLVAGRRRLLMAIPARRDDRGQVAVVVVLVAVDAVAGQGARHDPVGGVVAVAVVAPVASVSATIRNAAS